MTRSLRLENAPPDPSRPNPGYFVPPDQMLTGDGLDVRLRHLSSGNFSRIYEVVGDPGIVAALTLAPAFDKRLMVRARELAPDNLHLPYIVELGVVTGSSRINDLYAFAMPRYRVGEEALAALGASDREMLRTMEVCWQFDGWDEQFAYSMRCLEDELRSPDGAAAAWALAEAAASLKAESAAWSLSPRYEAPERNFAVSHAGRLIWLDLVYYIGQ